MKTIILFSLISIFLSATPSQACSLLPGYDIPMKNDIITAVANQYYVDIVNSEITLDKYEHKFAWKYSDSSFGCHDTDYFEIRMTLVFPDIWDTTKNCVVEVEVNQTAGPEFEDGPQVIEREIVELKNSCKDSF